MNLSLIFDSREDYLGLTSVSPNNLYFQIAQKTAKHITATTNKNKINIELSVLGNKVNFYYGDNQVNLVLGGKRYTGKGPSIKALEEALYNLFQGELKGEVALQRPDGRTMLSDRNDFNKAPGTCFTKLYKSVAWDKEGKRNSEVLGSRSNAVALTEQQFTNASSVKAFKADNFKRVSEGGVTFFLNKKTKFIDFTNAEFKSELDSNPEELSTKKFEYILRDIDSNLGYWARTPQLYQLSENIESYNNTACLYNNHVYLVIVNQLGYDVKILI